MSQATKVAWLLFYPPPNDFPTQKILQHQQPPAGLCVLGCKSRTDRKVFCFFRYLRSVLPWHFFPGRRGAAEAASFRSWGANLQKIAKLFCFFATCDLLHSVHFCGSQEKEAAAVPREAKLQKIANFMFLLLLPIFCNLCHFSICRTKTILQVSVYQKPFRLVGQRGVARHSRRECLAQSATFK